MNGKNNNLDILPMKQWDMDLGERPIIIAGPCSAETEEQVLSTAHLLSGRGIKIFRAGIWKPRTRPNTFSGVGERGLPWLRRVKQETGMMTTTEVASARHVYEALKYGIDILWIGARTTANPFLMQEIADALQGVDLPVMIKNPINPDLDLWIGAIERIYNAGIRRIAAIHRGFSTYGQSIYRNEPNWQIALDLKAQLPNIMLINDPSHIAGRRDLLQSVAQKAMDLSFDGLMIEAHITPEQAWSDAHQQITPDQLMELLSNLQLRKAQAQDRLLEEELVKLRAQIDVFDSLLMEILSDRMNVVRRIGELKKRYNMTIFQEKRWQQIILRAQQVAGEKGFSSSFVEKLFKLIHQESIGQQTLIMNKERKAEHATKEKA